jgi:hypothetical protein
MTSTTQIQSAFLIKCLERFHQLQASGKLFYSGSDTESVEDGRYIVRNIVLKSIRALNVLDSSCSSALLLV